MPIAGTCNNIFFFSVSILIYCCQFYCIIRPRRYLAGFNQLSTIKIKPFAILVRTCSHLMFKSNFIFEFQATLKHKSKSLNWRGISVTSRSTGEQKTRFCLKFNPRIPDFPKTYSKGILLLLSSLIDFSPTIFF